MEVTDKSQENSYLPFLNLHDGVGVNFTRIPGCSNEVQRREDGATHLSDDVYCLKV